MSDTLDHEDAMELAVNLTCPHLARTGSSSTQVEELIAHFYQQVRNAENRLKGDITPVGGSAGVTDETGSVEEEEETISEPEAAGV
jgi:hypothetical protein